MTSAKKSSDFRDMGISEMNSTHHFGYKTSSKQCRIIKFRRLRSNREISRVRPVPTVNDNDDEVEFGQQIWAVDRNRCVFPKNTTSRCNVDANELGQLWYCTYLLTYVPSDSSPAGSGRATEMNGCDQLRRPRIFNDEGHPSSSKIFSTKLKRRIPFQRGS